MPAAPRAEAAPGAADAQATDGMRSLVDDVENLVLDAKTWLDAELTYQKTRASFIADSLKRTVVFAVVGAVFGLFALLALTVGLLIALTPLVSAWGATAIVVGLWLVVALAAVRGAGNAWSDMMGAIRERDDEEGS